MSDYELLEYNGNIYKINYAEYEPCEVFFKRAWFIVKQEPQTIKDFQNIERDSFIWKNVEFLNCKYSDEVMKRLKNYKNIYI